MGYREELTCLTELLFTLHNDLTVWKNRSAAKCGLSPAQINTIEIIGHHYSLKMKELAARLGITTGSMTVMIDRLEKKGLVERKAAANDRRSIMVCLTETGRRIFLSRYRQQLEFIDKKFKNTSNTDRQEILASLQNFLNMIRDDPS